MGRSGRGAIHYLDMPHPINCVAIVNYTWMSFCFNYIPNDVFKICDTHDVVGGRRAMLERNGLSAEYFHTTESEEARGLARPTWFGRSSPPNSSILNNDLRCRIA